MYIIFVHPIFVQLQTKSSKHLHDFDKNYFLGQNNKATDTFVMLVRDRTWDESQHPTASLMIWLIIHGLPSIAH